MPDEDARITDFIPEESGDAEGSDGEAAPAEGSDGEAAPAEGSDGEAAPADEEEREDDTDAADLPDAEAAPPAEPTAAWQPGGTCDACGDDAARRWQEDDELVCADCREW